MLGKIRNEKNREKVLLLLLKKSFLKKFLKDFFVKKVFKKFFLKTVF